MAWSAHGGFEVVDSQICMVEVEGQGLGDSSSELIAVTLIRKATARGHDNDDILQSPC